MSRSGLRSVIILVLAIPVALVVARRGSGEPVQQLPDPLVNTAAAEGQRTAVLAGGCFWGIEAVYEHINGVIDVVSGYSGGSAETADYGRVSSGRTRHAESVRITYDPAKISYGELLKVFFSVAHDPTQLNRQGPDVGPHYRSAIFYADEEQATVARAYIEQLTGEKVFDRPIVTQVVALEAFYVAEDYHQDYAKRHPDDLYIVIHDRPKVENLRKQFPSLYRDR